MSPLDLIVATGGLVVVAVLFAIVLMVFWNSGIVSMVTFATPVTFYSSAAVTSSCLLFWLFVKYVILA